MNAPTFSIPEMGHREFNFFRDMIHRETGIYLKDSQQVMLTSRLVKRLRQLSLNSFAAYAVLLQQPQDDGKELSELINCITTNKTSFFRENHHFEFIAQKLVPDLVAGALLGRKKRLRIWSAACSTGEEPYSIAISVLDALNAAYPSSGALIGPAGGWELEIIASDIDTRVLAKGADGIYDQESVAGLPPDIKARYFLRGKNDRAGQVVVKKELSRFVKFTRINLMDSKWAVEGAFHVIFFRNALIYFNRETQELFLRKMLSYLQPAGYLILGHSEHVPWLNDQVKPLGNTIHQLLPVRRPPYTGPDRRRRPR